jgi:hypothetical protein
VGFLEGVDPDVIADVGDDGVAGLTSGAGHAGLLPVLFGFGVFPRTVAFFGEFVGVDRVSCAELPQRDAKFPVASIAVLGVADEAGCVVVEPERLEVQYPLMGGHGV